MATYTTQQKQQEARPSLPHKLTLDERSRLAVTGVTEVVSFDESAVVLKTVKGVLVIRGQQLHLQTLSLDGGQVAVDGTVSSMNYEELRREGGFFSRLFG